MMLTIQGFPSSLAYLCILIVFNRHGKKRLVFGISSLSMSDWFSWSVMLKFTLNVECIKSGSSHSTCLPHQPSIWILTNRLVNKSGCLLWNSSLTVLQTYSSASASQTSTMKLSNISAAIACFTTLVLAAPTPSDKEARVFQASITFYGAPPDTSSYTLNFPTDNSNVAIGTSYRFCCFPKARSKLDAPSSDTAITYQRMHSWR